MDSIPNTEAAQVSREAAADTDESRRAALSSAFARWNITLDKLIQEYATIAFSDIKNYVQVDEGGSLQAIPLENIKPKKATKAVKKIKETTRITEKDDGSILFKESKIEYELYDKLNALDKLIELGDFEPAQRQETMHRGTIIVEDPFAKYR